MPRAILYTGTFDPYHLGHVWQLERVYRAHPFDKVVVAIVRQNPKKPHATSWQQRIALAKLALSSKSFPFAIDIQIIDYVEPEKLQKFVHEHLPGYDVSRTVASDVIHEFVEDERLRPALTMFHYLVVVRPLVGRIELERRLAQLPAEVAEHFSYEIVHEQTEADIAASDLRKDIKKAYAGGFITKAQYDYMVREDLYRVPKR